MRKRGRKTAVSERNKENAFGALKGTYRSLIRNNKAYDDGDYHASRDLSVLLARSIQDELPKLGILSHIAFADTTRIPAPETLPARMLNTYAPYCGLTLVNDDPPLFKYEHPWAEADILEEIDGAQMEPAALQAGLPSEIVAVVRAMMQPSLVWKPFEKWRRQTVFWECDDALKRRRAEAHDASLERCVLNREKVIFVLRNETGAHFDRIVSSDYTSVENAHSGFSLKTEGIDAIAMNTPSQSVIRAMSGEFTYSIKKYYPELDDPT